jgi:uncharacterized membrane protein YdjX (TVP38/TMEM64 family)
VKYKNKKYLGLILVATVVLAFLLLRTKLDFSLITNITYLKNTILSFGIFAPIVFIIIMAIAIVISPIPSMPLASSAGMIWGPITATILAVIGAEIGAIISFLIARTLGKKAVEKLIHKNIVFCEDCDEKTVTFIVFIARLFPFFQFDIISYGAGLTNIKLRNFALATFVGMIPMTYVFAKFGTVLMVGNLTSILLTVALISAMFIVPWLLKRHNLFKLDKYK